MRHFIKEHSILFAGVMKWTFLAAVVGVMVGISTTLFIKALHWTIDFSGQYDHYYIVLPLALFMNALILHYFAPHADSYSMDKVIERVHKVKRIPFLSIPKAFFLPILTISSGGSAGKEAPAAEVGAGLGSFLSSLFRLNAEDRNKLIICGVSAGFAAVFGTPVAGAVFGLEALFVGSIMYEILLPPFIAGITAYHVAKGLGLTYMTYPVQTLPHFDGWFFLYVIGAGLFFGLCSVLLIEFMKMTRKYLDKWQIWKPLKGLLGGLLLVGLTLLFSKQFLGLGTETITDAIDGKTIIWYAFLLKIVYTTITLAFGGTGGLVTPIFFIGATAGSLFAQVFHLNPGIFAAMGLAGLLAGATNTPLAASILAIELFGPEVGSYAVIACVISYLITGHRSIYPSQVLAVKKSPHSDVEIGKRLDSLHERVAEKKNIAHHDRE